MEGRGFLGFWCGGGGSGEGGEGWGGALGWVWEEVVCCEGLFCVAWSLVNHGFGWGGHFCQLTDVEEFIRASGVFGFPFLGCW